MTTMYNICQSWLQYPKTTFRWISLQHKTKLCTWRVRLAYLEGHLFSLLRMSCKCFSPSLSFSLSDSLSLSLSLSLSHSLTLSLSHTHTHRSLEPVVSATILAISAVWCVVSVLMVSPILSPTLSRSTVSKTTTCKLTFESILGCSKLENNICINIAWGEYTIHGWTYYIVLTLSQYSVGHA